MIPYPAAFPEREERLSEVFCRLDLIPRQDSAGTLGGQHGASGRVMGIDDTIQVRCSRCKSKFRDKARRIRDGYSRQCPACECIVFFIDGSPNKDVQEAFREAERVRKLLREEEYEKIASRAQTTEQAEDDGEEAAPAVSRSVYRRSPSSGRAGRPGRSGRSH
jgi:hypothetical protein